MSATAERSKLDMLAEQEARLSEEVDAARARIAEYPAQLQEAREKSWYSSPKRRPGSELNGDVAKITARERKDLTAMQALEGDLSAVRAVIATEAARLALEETAEARRQLEVLHAQEESLWKTAGSQFAELAATWNNLVDQVELESRLASSNGIDAAVLAVEPTPASFRAFLLLLHTAATDPAVHAEPQVQELTETGIFGRRDKDGDDIGGAVYDTRPVAPQTIDVRRRLDEHDRLVHLIPALGGIVRKLQLNGRVRTIASE